MVANTLANLTTNVSVPETSVFALGNTVEPLIVSELILRWFGSTFSIDRLRHLIGLFVAGCIGAFVSVSWYIVSYKLFFYSAAPTLTLWQDWFMGIIVGIITVAPFVIGLSATLQQQPPPPRSEVIEGVTALLTLGAMTAIIVSLSREQWETLVPSELLFPILLWVSVRCRPFFAAAGAFLVCFNIVWMTVFGVDHFGDSAFSLEDRIEWAQANMLVVAIGALVLAVLFAERRENEAHLARANTLLERERERLARANAMLERERDNKLMNVQAIMAAIAHEIRQPLAAIVSNASAGLRWIGRSPPDHDEVRAVLNTIKDQGHRANEVFDGIRTLFGKGDQQGQAIDVNRIIVAVLIARRREGSWGGNLPGLVGEPTACQGPRGTIARGYV
jgi:integral membrane sensor domain MASE1